MVRQGAHPIILEAKRRMRSLEDCYRKARIAGFSFSYIQQPKQIKTHGHFLLIKRKNDRKKRQKNRIKNDNNKTPSSPTTAHPDSELTLIEKPGVFATLLREEQRARARMTFSCSEMAGNVQMK